ncbi:hypothetical protein HanPI659440_Chr08g0307761 [Helianthus annuus]|nr:hypothetical protein HanPI659440_Chr08g0307761 [Helianthus annuus]
MFCSAIIPQTCFLSKHSICFRVLYKQEEEKEITVERGRKETRRRRLGFRRKHNDGGSCQGDLGF